MANVGSILGGAFRLFRDQPVAIVIWAVVFALYSFATSGVMLGGAGAQFGMMEALRSGAVSPLNIAGAGLLIIALSLAFSSIMACAVYRVVLRPDERSFGGLRLGMDELRMMGLFLILIVAGIFLGLIFILVFALLLGGTFAATGGGGGSVLIIALLYIAMLCGFIYLGVRLSLIAPMTFVRRRIAIDAGWALTRGRFWMLFLVFLVIIVLTLVLYSVAVAPFAGPFLGEMVRAMSNPESLRSAQAQEVSMLAAQPLATTILLTVLGAIVQAIGHALYGGAAATAVRELLRDEGEVLEDDIEATAQIFE